MKLPLRLTLIAALAAPASLALAQEAPNAVDAPRGRRGGPGMHARGHRGHGMFRILAELNLTDNQKTQIRAIFESSRERRQELRGQGRSPETREAMRGLHEETRRLVREVLTPAQRTQAQRLRRQHMQQHLQQRVNRMAERLSLTNAQKTAVTRIFENAGTQRRVLFQAGNVDRDAMRAIHEQTRTELSGVLSAEQMAQLGEMRGRRGHGRHGRHGRGGNGRGNGVAPIRNAAP